MILTYADDQNGYPHPDHLRVHDISVPAFDAAGDPDYYPDPGRRGTPLKLYYSVWSRARILAMHEKFVELGLDSPFDRLVRPSGPGRPDHHPGRRSTGFDDVRLEALLAHATQVDPTSPFWFGLPARCPAIHPFDDYILADSRVDTDCPRTTSSPVS